MPFDSDLALLGTGVAPLLAASHLLSQGKSVLLLNPDFDFFLEDSELPLDPLWPVTSATLNPERLARSHPEAVLEELRPDFPGAVEFWTEGAERTGFHDREAPHVRQRSRIIIPSIAETGQFKLWEKLEDVYLTASDAGLKPQLLEQLLAAKRFPGFSGSDASSHGLMIPKLCDVDVTRYRNGLLEFVHERLGENQMVCAASQIEIMPGGVRFHAFGGAQTAKLREGMLVFWTPRLTQWILAHAKKFEVQPKLPSGVRLWEQWSLISRDPLDPTTVGAYGDMTVWAEIEGEPPTDPRDPSLHLLSALRAGKLVSPSELSGSQGGMSWASSDSFGQLSDLCHGFLKWERFSVRAMKPRAIFEWESTRPWTLSSEDPEVRVIPGCDGPLFRIANIARSAAQGLIEEGG